jgi:protoporphyrinogen oxidase
VRKGCKAVGVNLDRAGHVRSLTCEQDGKTIEIEGDVFISSMPVKDLVEGMNDVPAELRSIASGLPYRDFVTVGLLVDKLNLKNETSMKTLGDVVPDCWIYIQDTDVKLGRIQIFNNWSPYLVKDPDRTVWIGLEYFCNEGDDFWNMSEADCTEFAIGELIQMGIINDHAQVADSHMEHVKKAYPAYFDTYKDMDRLKDFLAGFENLYCIGRNGQHRYNNMDHSMGTAFEAVNVILSGATSQEDIWNVNTEKEYHEKK